MLSNIENLLLIPFEHFLSTELFIAVSALFLLVFAVCKGDKSSNYISFYGVIILIIATILLDKTSGQGQRIVWLFASLSRLYVCYLLYVFYYLLDIQNIIFVIAAQNFLY